MYLHKSWLFKVFIVCCPLPVLATLGPNRDLLASKNSLSLRAPSRQCSSFLFFLCSWVRASLCHWFLILHARTFYSSFNPSDRSVSIDVFYPSLSISIHLRSVCSWQQLTLSPLILNVVPNDAMFIHLRSAYVRARMYHVVRRLL